MEVRETPRETLLAVASRMETLDLRAIRFAAVFCEAMGIAWFLLEPVSNRSLGHSVALLLLGGFLLLLGHLRSLHLRKQHAWMARRPRRLRGHLRQHLDRRIRQLNSPGPIVAALALGVLLNFGVYSDPGRRTPGFVAFSFLLPGLMLAQIAWGRLFWLDPLLRDRASLGGR